MRGVALVFFGNSYLEVGFQRSTLVSKIQRPASWVNTPNSVTERIGLVDVVL
jgi:hypothetical protein